MATMMVENPILHKRRVGDNNSEKSYTPYVKPGEIIWQFCEEMATKYDISQKEAYDILEKKIVQMAKLHEDKGARITVAIGETNVEVNFFKEHKEIGTPPAP